MSIPREGYIYFIKSEDGLYKIGRAVEVDHRLKQIQPKYPYTLTFELILFSVDMVGDEKKLHERFADKRLKGEWFRLDDWDLIDLGLNNPRYTYEEYLEYRASQASSYEIDELFTKMETILGEKKYREFEEEILKVADMLAIRRFAKSPWEQSTEEAGK